MFMLMWPLRQARQIANGPALKRTLCGADPPVVMQMRLTLSTCCRVVVGEVG